MRTWLLVAAIGGGCGSGGSDPPGAPVTPPSPADTPVADASSPQPAPDVPDAEAATDPAPKTEVELPPTEPDPLASTPDQSTSVGSPTRGHLDGALPLPLTASGLLFLPSKDPESRHGTVELVQGLVRAAAAVEQADPGAPVTVGDLSRPAGGDISGHASHRSGRDVDVLFYLTHEDGRPFVPSKFIPLDPEGRGTDYGDLADPADDVPVRIDVARTWSFVAALLTDEQAAVQKILIVEHLRSQLLAEAQRVGAPADIVKRFGEVTCQPRFPHDDHMHIRVFCSAEDIAAGCEDTRPIYPWRKRELAAVGVKPVLVGSTPKPATPDEPKPKLKLKTLAEARAEAGPMHEDVVEFLDRRESWARKPHPGRRYCR